MTIESSRGIGRILPHTAYVAAAWPAARKAADFTARLQRHGIRSTATWIGEAIRGGPRCSSVSAETPEFWQVQRCLVRAQIDEADVLIYLHTDYPTRGASWEQGIAYALGKPIVIYDVAIESYRHHIGTEGCEVYGNFQALVEGVFK